MNESVNSGTDTVQAAITYSLAVAALANVENLVLTGTTAISGTGNALANTLDGSQNTAANQLSGGAGDDTYIVGTGDTVVEAANAGIDTVRTALVSYTLGTNVENLTGLAATSQTLTGNTLANQITGGSGNDILNGLGGADTMTGGLGNDSYTVDDAGDVVVESVNAGTDTVQASITYSLALAALANIENVSLLGIGAINATGNDLANALTGNSAANILDGRIGNDSLTGAAGNDTLTGGLGSDTFIFSAGFGRDTINDFAAGAGIADVVQLSMGTAFDTFAEVLARTTQVGADSVITFDANTSITLKNTNRSALVADDFKFVI